MRKTRERSKQRWGEGRAGKILRRGKARPEPAIGGAVVSRVDH